MNLRGDFSANRRLIFLSVIACAIGAFCAVIAVTLLSLINFFTNLFYFQQFSLSSVTPAQNHMGYLVIFMPVLGGLIIGLMAKFGSEKIRGHGIPEALEAILYGKSIIQPKVALLKPLSSAISIGSGGPFGAEGPIIMTGGAFGSIIAQRFCISAAERKTLLVAGAAAGMSATFGSPVAAVLLAVELLLFEWKPRSLVPVSIASVVAAGIRPYFFGTAPLFALSLPENIGSPNLLWAAILGIVAGLFATALSSSLYKVEDFFHRLPIHWMWWPAIGGLIVGLGGLIRPQALGVGYDVIGELVRGDILPIAAMSLVAVKATIWIFSLASGTSGGVLAPLLMMGASLGLLSAGIIPGHHPLWPLIGMAAVLGGMMRAPFTAVVFAIELTHNISGLTALLVASIFAYAVTVLIMKRSILTEKIARRGLDIFREYGVDPLEKIQVKAIMTSEIVSIPQNISIEKVLLDFFSGTTKHRGYPVVDENQKLVGVLTSSDLLKIYTKEATESLEAIDLIKRPAITISPYDSCRLAAELMARHQIGRLPVIDHTMKMVGIITRSDLLKPRLLHFDEEMRFEQIVSQKKMNRTG